MPFRAVQRAFGVALFFVAGGGLAGLEACGSDAVGVDACRKVEEARCDRAPDCGIDLARLGSANDVAGCKRYYRDACLHGIVPAAEPAATDLDRCVAALTTATCAAVESPVLLAECSWLGAPPPVLDAGADGDADAS